MSAAHPLRVAEVLPIGRDAVSVVFQVPAELEAEFKGVAGQHLVVRLKIEGEEVRRPYSLSSSPEAGQPPAISVKSLPEGRASRFLTREIEPGMEIAVEPPKGNFVLDGSSADRLTYYMFAAGIGITPLLSMMRTLASTRSGSTTHLLYCNRSRRTALFHDELVRLTRAGCCSVAHHYTRPPWRSSAQRLNVERVQRFLRQHPPETQDCRYMLCGPNGFIDTVRRALTLLGVRDRDVSFERFRPPPAEVMGNHYPNATLVARGPVKSLTTELKPRQTLLSALRAEGVDAPFACESGVCGTCAATLEDGEVQMPITSGLSTAEIEQGRVLLCQARATTENVRVALDR